MNFIEIVDYVGVFVFAISGALVAIRHDMDLLGILVISLLPAIGGGTLRDMLLDVEVFWLRDPAVVSVALCGGISAILYKSWTKFRMFLWVDALGLALFATMGTEKAYSLGFGFHTSVMMGAITATAGGLIRDIVCNESPILLKKEIYAIAALAGSALCYLLLTLNIPTAVCLLAGFSLVFIIRVLAMYFNLSLPRMAWVERKIAAIKNK